jgi:hypothetical protein
LGSRKTKTRPSFRRVLRGDVLRTFLRNRQGLDPRVGSNVDQKYAVLQAITGGRSARDTGATAGNDGVYGKNRFCCSHGREKYFKIFLDKDDGILKDITYCFSFERVSK